MRKPSSDASPLDAAGTSKVASPLRKVGAARGRGTTICFRPDTKIFPDVRFDPKRIAELYGQQVLGVAPGRLTLGRSNTAFEYGVWLANAPLKNESAPVQLRVALAGTGGDEAIHCVLDLMYVGAPYPVLQRAMHIHPTVAELLPSLAQDLAPT